MSVDTIRKSIEERATKMLVPALMKAGIAKHKKKWRDCPCSWCQTKREATIVIGTHVPRAYRGFYAEDTHVPRAYRGFYAEDTSGIWREEKRREYRKKLASLEEEQ